MEDLKKKNSNELTKDLVQKREELRLFRFGIAGSKTRNIKEGRDIRRDIARILTELRARQNLESKA